MPACILVVDDNLINLKLICDILAFEDYAINQATNAEEALASIIESPPDLILMDIELPGTDGLTLTRMLKASASTKHIPIVALTAFAMKGDDQRAFDAGCKGYITKPIDTRKFPQLILEFLKKNEKGI